MATAIWRISDKLNILLYPEFVEKQANEGWNFTSIEVRIF